MFGNVNFGMYDFIWENAKTVEIYGIIFGIYG